MTQRTIPTAMRPGVEGPFEHVMALGVRIPGKLGYIARRKLKRRQCARMQDTFSQVLADTRAGDLCIDLGANVGEITRRMAATGADVISFEPDPGAFDALQAATSDMANVTLVAKAAGHKQDSLLLHRSARWSSDDPSGHTQGSSLVHSEAGADASNAIRVEVVDIIAYLESLDRDIRILKMDIEGAEWDIMTRLMDHPLLSRIDTIFVETHERQDPARYVPVFDDLQARAEQISRPYINLYWV
ncbi:MAG: FkbM family methyltransferase [Pseudomonadota bacterium]